MDTKLKDYEWLEIQTDGTYPMDGYPKETEWFVVLPELATDQVMQIIEDHGMVIINSREEGPRDYLGEIDAIQLDGLFLNKAYVCFGDNLALYRHDFSYQLLMKRHSLTRSGVEGET